MNCLELFIYKMMSSSNRAFYFFHFNLDIFDFIFFSNCPARTSSTASNKNGESSHFILFSIIGKESLQLFIIKHNIRCDFSQMDFVKLRKFPSIPNLLSAYVRKRCGFCLILFSVSIEIIMCFFCLHSINVVY